MIHPIQFPYFKEKAMVIAQALEAGWLMVEPELETRFLDFPLGFT